MRSLTGTRFPPDSRLTVLEERADGFVRARCDCGKIVLKKRKNLMEKSVRSCGCLRKDAQEAVRTRQRALVASVVAMRRGGMDANAIAEKVGRSYTTIMRYLRKYRGRQYS